jgi:glucan phosphoethanolaminetransferase (alkaline phosphatase superfamily)
MQIARTSETLESKQNYILEKGIQFFGLIIFSVLLLVLEEIFTDYLQSKHLFWMILQEYRSERPPIAYLSFLFAFIWMVIYCWAAFRASKPVRVLLAIFFMLAVFIQYGYFLTFHRMMTALDFWTAFNSPLSLWNEAIGMYINWSALVITVTFVLGVAYNWKKQRSRWFPEVILAIFVAASLLFQTYTPYDLATGNSVIKFTQLLGRIHLSDQKFIKRESIPQIEHKPPENNILLVIDESLRGDHLSINNYPRETTPTLKRLMEQGSIKNWGIAVASATCSYSSNPQILTGFLLKAGEYNLVSSWPTIFQYANAMGYRTYYLDAQENYMWNGLTPKDQKYIDIWKSAKDFGENNLSDKKAAQYIWQEIHNSNGNFIVLNKKGMHIKYENNYPVGDGHWFPTPMERNYRKFPSFVINAYDNAVNYNLENFFQSLLPEGKPLPNTVILYTSDHGETLQEKGEAWSHCHDSSPEAAVPLFMVGETEHLPDLKYQASHSNIFPTLLDLMNVPEESRVKQYNYSLFKANFSLNESRYFLDSDLKPNKYIPIYP